MKSNNKRSIIIKPVSSRRDRRIFLLFPWRLYRSDPHWVPPLLSEHKATIDPEKNDLFNTGDVALFIAWRDRQPVGTIGLAIDVLDNKNREEPVAVFGFFECIEDFAISNALLRHAVEWTRARHIHLLRGPQSFSSSDEPGLLIEGRETPRGMLMNWTMPYYKPMLEEFGFKAWVDSLAYRVYLADYVGEDGQLVLPGGIQRINRYLRRRYDEQRCHLRLGNLDNWEADSEIARSVYNRGLSNLPNFVPMKREDWQRFALSLKPLLSSEFIVFVELDGQPVAFALAFPDVNTALLHCNGLRFPWNYIQFWWHSRKLPGLCFKILVMLPEFHGLGLDAHVYEHIAVNAYQKGYAWVDMSLTGADNPTTNKLASRVGAQIDKRYRVYEYQIHA
ncbi:MAG: hypothetical protein P1S60_00785 [Anaerolineae bacterium]|nr:hypothetical protein [Anaerolineae bacterium]